MRDAIAATFDASATLGPDIASSDPDDPFVDDNKIMNPNIDPGTADVEAHDRERRMLAAREKELSAPKMKQLRDDVLDWFDHWRESTIGRVGEVLNSTAEAKKRMNDPATQEVKPELKAVEDKKIEPDVKFVGDLRKGDEEAARIASETLLQLYPPVKSPLAELDESKRALILHSLLLLLLSLEHYAAPSRALLLYLINSLHLPISALNQDETKTAQGLLEAAKELSGESETQKKIEENAKTRKYKVGIATALGAAIGMYPIHYSHSCAEST